MNVKISPSSHVDDSGLLDMSMEEIVAHFLEREKRRYQEAKDDENQQEVIISAKVTPMGLIAVLDSAAHDFHISRSLLTRCLSHQVASWYNSIPDLDSLTGIFYEAHKLAVDNGYPDLCSGLRNNSYQYTSILADMPTSFRSIAWVRNKLGSIATPLGLSATLLFHVGLCHSIASSDSGSYRGTIDKFLRREVDKLLAYTGERFLYVNGFVSRVNYHVGRDS